MQEAVNATGGIPPGNAPGPEKAKWQPARPAPPRPEIKLTPGKGAEDLMVDITAIVDMVVKNERIVAFIKVCAYFGIYTMLSTTPPPLSKVLTT